VKRSKIIFIVLALLLIVFLSVILSFHISNIVRNQSDKEVEILVIIDFGALKETDNYLEYYVNVTEGSSAFDAFTLVANLTITNYPFGVYIRGVNGYMEELPNFWIFYYYDLELKEWVYSAVGVSHYYLYEGYKIKLQYNGQFLLNSCLR